MFIQNRLQMLKMSIVSLINHRWLPISILR